MYWQIFDGTNVQYFGLTKRSVTDFKERLGLYPSFYRIIDQEKFIQLLALSLYRLKRGFSIDKIPSEMREMIHLTISFEQFKEELIVPLVKDNYMLKEVTEKEYIFLFLRVLKSTFLSMD
nr:hypothetical protein [Enterococcus faecium]